MTGLNSNKTNVGNGGLHLTPHEAYSKAFDYILENFNLV